METNRFGMSLSFDVGIAEVVGIPAAVVYNELKFWSDKGSRDDGWVYKSYAEMLEKLPLSEYQLRKAYKLLEENGIIEVSVKKVDGAPTFHYRFLKNFSFHSEKTSETMETEKTSETYIYTDNYHNTDTDSVSGSNPEGIRNDPADSSAIPSEEDFRIITRILKESDRVKYLNERKKLFVSRLKNFTMDEIKQAAVNLSNSPFHMGANDTKTKYADFDFLMRNDKQVDKWLNKTPVQQKKSVF